jgi:hypothetical protein
MTTFDTVSAGSPLSVTSSTTGTGVWRARAMAGQLHSGRLIRDPRSEDRRCL